MPVKQQMVASSYITTYFKMKVLNIWPVQSAGGDRGGSLHVQERPLVSQKERIRKVGRNRRRCEISLGWDRAFTEQMLSDVHLEGWRMNGTVFWKRWQMTYRDSL